MLCTQVALYNTQDGYTDVKPLPCRSWGCDLCAPQRRRQLMAIAASGEPNRCITLTITDRIGQSPADRYRLLHDAWKRLVKRILRQFALPPAKRWLRVEPDGAQWQEIRAYTATQSVKQAEYTRLHYMSFAEETKRGEPHLHILVRSPYIPVDWISEQMRDLIRSPVVWVDRINGARKAIAYVTKYVTKAPAQFGVSRRYWVSRGYRLRDERPEPPPGRSRVGIQVVRQRWSELTDRVRRERLTPLPLGDGWFRLYRPIDLTREWEAGRILNFNARVLAGYRWLATDGCSTDWDGPGAAADLVGDGASGDDLPF